MIVVHKGVFNELDKQGYISRIKNKGIKVLDPLHSQHIDIINVL
jgi:hypothetical protein